MENRILTEEKVKEVLEQVLSEQLSKVKREDYSRIQFKIEELENSLNETLKEFRKLELSVPEGLKTVSNGRISGISSSLSNAQKLIAQLKSKIRHHKKSVYTQQVEEKKK